jgi:hypothetical protein
MVRAILAGRKTQTRRKLKFQEWDDAIIKRYPRQKAGVPFAVGDILWVRETWAAPHICDTFKPSEIEIGERVHYAATADFGGDNNLGGLIGRPSIFMPRWASRLTLEVTDVRVERLQAISEADAIAEGVEAVESERDEHDWSICPKCGGTGLHGALGDGLGYMEVDCQECNTHKKRYSHLWNHINGDGAWEANPFVVAVSFKVHKCNVDAFERSEAA